MREREREREDKAVFKSANIEISGLCNAKCPWCPTGSTPIAERVNKFMAPELFEQIVARISKENLLPHVLPLRLYTDGEPTLHPDFPIFFEIAYKYGYKVAISTNASKYVPLPDSALKNMSDIIFSVSGMTQANYGRIHGFEIASVLENIRAWCKDLDRVESQAKRIMSFHVYKFNHDDIDEAQIFCFENGINFDPIYAFFGGIAQRTSYIEHRLSEDIALRISEDIELFYVKDIMAKCSSDYRCRQPSQLMINEAGQMLLCCWLTRNCESYSLGYFLDMPLHDILELRFNQPVCEKCINTGMVCWLDHTEHYKLPSLLGMDVNLDWLVQEHESLADARIRVGLDEKN